MNNTHISSFVYHGVLIVGVGLVSVAGCPTQREPTAAAPTSSERLLGLGKQASAAPLPRQTSDFEDKLVLKAQDLVPRELLKSKDHTVHEDVRTDRFTNTYTISSKFGTFTAHGDEMLNDPVNLPHAQGLLIS